MESQFLNDAPIAIVTTHRDQQIISANNACCALLHRNMSDLIGKSLDSFSNKDSAPIIQNMASDPISTPQADIFLKTDLHSALPVRIHVTATDNKMCWYIENRLEQAEARMHLDRLRNLPREYGHDINNLLTVILSAAQMIQFDIDDDSPLREDLDDIIHAGNRAASQTRLFMNLGRKGVSLAKTFCVNALIRQLRHLLFDLIGEKGHLSIDLCKQRTNIHSPIISVQACISHLCVHARLKKPTGCFCLESRVVPVNGHFATNIAGLVQGNYIAVTLREEQFELSDDMLTTDVYYEPDEADALSLAWEGVARARGSIIQRVSPEGFFCVTLFFPEVTSFTEVQS